MVGGRGQAGLTDFPAGAIDQRDSEDALVAATGNGLVADHGRAGAGPASAAGSAKADGSAVEEMLKF